MKSYNVLGKQDLAELKNFVKTLKADIEATIAEDPDYSGEADMIMAAIANAEEGLALKDGSLTPERKTARVLADVMFLRNMVLQAFDDEENGDDDEDDDFDLDDDEDDDR